MPERIWKNAQRRDRVYLSQRNAKQLSPLDKPFSQQSHVMTHTGTDLISIKEGSTERSFSSRSGHSRGGSMSSSINSSSSNRSSRSRKEESNSTRSVTSESVNDVFQMLENEHVKYCHPNANADNIGTQEINASEMSLEKEIQAEIGDISISVESNKISPPPPRHAFKHQQNGALTPGTTSQSDDESEDGPMIYTNPEDDDDFSQITSSIAGNTLYSHEYMFSSISIPKNRPTGSRGFSATQSSAVPSLDGTDSGGSGGSSRSAISQLPPMDEKKALVMDNDDFDRFFGGSSTGASQRRTGKSRDDNDAPINIYNNSTGRNSHIHSHNHISSHASVLDEQNGDDITIGDIYTYAPSTVGGDSTVQVNSSSPIIWMYNQAYSLFSNGRSNRKKNDDFDDQSIDRDADYFGTMMSSDFLSSSPNDVPWRKGRKARNSKFLKAFSIIGGLFFLGALASSGDLGTDSDLSMNPNINILEGQGFSGNEQVKTVTDITEVRKQERINLPRKEKSDRSHEGMPLPKIFDNFADVTEDAAGTIPFYWHIPRTAGATMNDIFSICHSFRVATNIGVAGGHGADTSLQVVKYEEQQFVNVDISTNEGIQRAIDMGFASSDLTDVAISSLLHDSAPLFSPTRKGKIFTFFRHPVDRLVSMFYFMQDTVWKNKDTYNKELANISIENFFLKQLGENNWHVRFLTNQLTKSYVDEDDFKLAKEILRRKALIGILGEKDESFDRFAKHFGWKPKRGRDLDCQQRKLQWDWSLRHPHEVEVLEGNRLWNLISGQNSYDIRLYEYAQQLFKEQAQIFQ